jgi:hypothetical protein
MNITSTDILSDISSGKLDASLASINQALNFRLDGLKAIEARRLKRSITVGDTLYFVQTANPSYIRGLAALVVKINPVKVVVTIVDKSKAGRFTGRVTCPADILSTTPTA